MMACVTRHAGTIHFRRNIRGALLSAPTDVREHFGIAHHFESETYLDPTLAARRWSSSHQHPNQVRSMAPVSQSPEMEGRSYRYAWARLWRFPVRGRLAVSTPWTGHANKSVCNRVTDNRPM